MRYWLLYPLLPCWIGAPTSAADPSPLVTLAREAVRAEVLGRALPTGHGSSPARPVFVTIERNGRVVGCRGALECRSRTLEQEVVLAARAAAAHDPRYHPLSAADLDGFLVTVTCVERLEPITEGEAKSLPPAEGLVLRSGEATGVVLPWEGKDPQVRLQWAYRKAGVRFGSSCRLYRMIAERERG